MHNRLGAPIGIYGDPAYPISDFLTRAPEGNNLTQVVQEYATCISHYRALVEWVFGKMGELWPFINDARQKMTSSRATSKEDCVAALLTYCHTCHFGGVANSFF